MAYLDLKSENLLEGGFVRPAYSARARTLTDLEKNSVMLARIDPVSSIDDDGLRRRLADFLFGPSKVNRLADPRLEALRSFGVAVAHGRDDLVDRDESRLLALGFHPAQIREARTIALAWRRPATWLQQQPQPGIVWRVSTLSLY